LKISSTQTLTQFIKAVRQNIVISPNYTCQYMHETHTL